MKKIKITRKTLIKNAFFFFLFFLIFLFSSKLENSIAFAFTTGTCTFEEGLLCPEYKGKTLEEYRIDLITQIEKLSHQRNLVLKEKESLEKNIERTEARIVWLGKLIEKLEEHFEESEETKEEEYLDLLEEFIGMLNEERSAKAKEKTIQENVFDLLDSLFQELRSAKTYLSYLSSASENCYTNLQTKCQSTCVWTTKLVPFPSFKDFSEPKFSLWYGVKSSYKGLCSSENPCSMGDIEGAVEALSPIWQSISGEECRQIVQDILIKEEIQSWNYSTYGPDNFIGYLRNFPLGGLLGDNCESLRFFCARHPHQLFCEIDPFRSTDFARYCVYNPEKEICATYEEIEICPDSNYSPQEICTKYSVTGDCLQEETVTWPSYCPGNPQHSNCGCKVLQIIYPYLPDYDFRYSTNQQCDLHYRYYNFLLAHNRPASCDVLRFICEKYSSESFCKAYPFDNEGFATLCNEYPDEPFCSVVSASQKCSMFFRRWLSCGVYPPYQENLLDFDGDIESICDDYSPSGNYNMGYCVYPDDFKEACEKNFYDYKDVCSDPFLHFKLETCGFFDYYDYYNYYSICLSPLYIPSSVIRRTISDAVTNRSPCVVCDYYDYSPGFGGAGMAYCELMKMICEETHSGEFYNNNEDLQQACSNYPFEGSTSSQCRTLLSNLSSSLGRGTDYYQGYHGFPSEIFCWLLYQDSCPIEEEDTREKGITEEIEEEIEKLKMNICELNEVRILLKLFYENKRSFCNKCEDLMFTLKMCNNLYNYSRIRIRCEDLCEEEE